MSLSRSATATRGSDGTPTAASQPIARWFAIVVLAALALLVLFRQLFGSIRVEVGTR
jgi:hypothetical protein